MRDDQLAQARIELGLLGKKCLARDSELGRDAAGSAFLSLRGCVRIHFTGDLIELLLHRGAGFRGSALPASADLLESHFGLGIGLRVGLDALCTLHMSFRLSAFN